MPTTENKLDINTFYPEESLKITDKYHGTYIRRVQDIRKRQTIRPT